MGNKANRRRKIRRAPFGFPGRKPKQQLTGEEEVEDDTNKTVYHVSVKCYSQAEADELIRKLRARRFTHHCIPHRCRGVGARVASTGQSSPSKIIQPSTSDDNSIIMENGDDDEDEDGDDDDDDDVERMDDDDDPSSPENEGQSPSVGSDDDGEDDAEGDDDDDDDDDDDEEEEEEQVENGLNDDGWEEDGDQELQYLTQPSEIEHGVEEQEKSQLQQFEREEEESDDSPMPMLATFDPDREEEDFILQR